MKNIRLMSFATVLIALFMSVGAFAQDVNLSVDKCYLQPGNAAKVTVKINNKVTFGALATEVKLPEGLSFVKTKNLDGGFEFSYSTTELTKGSKVTVIFIGKKDNEAILQVAKSNEFAPSTGDCDFIVLDVNVADNFVAGDITFADVNATRYDLETDSYTDWKQDGFTATVYNEAELYTPSVADFEIEPGKEATAAFGFAFDKVVMNMSFNVELPEGLTIDEDSYTPSAERIPNHEITVKKSGRVTIMPNGSSPDYDFIGTEGTLFTFTVKASEDFKGGEIKFYDLMAKTQAGENGIQTYYAKDFVVKVAKKDITTGINGIETIGEAADGIYQLNGVRTDKMQRGVNIVIKDGKAIKVVKK